MRIRSIRLENVRRFTNPVEITGIGDGLNVLTAPNERGKSTFFDALHAVFFKDRKSWDKEIKALVPHAGGDPAVAIEIELPEGSFRIEKRWNSKRSGDVRITSEGRLIKQADDAQTWISDTLKSPKDGGPAGLLWVRQGQSGLDEGGDLHRARQNLLTSVAGEIEAMTGGRRMDLASETCRNALARYLTATGRVKSDSPLKRAEDTATALQVRQRELEQKSGELRQELDRRREFRRELAELEDPEAEQAIRLRLSESKRTLAKAERHREALQRALELESTKRVKRDLAAKRLEALENNLAELKEANGALASAQAEEERRTSEANAADSEMSEASTAYEAARKGLAVAVDVLKKTLGFQAAVSAEDRRIELNRQLRRAETLRQQLELATANAGKEISERCLLEIEGLDEDYRVLKRTRDLEAASITMHYAPGRQDGISLDSTILPDREPVAIPDGAELEIESLGQLSVHPGRRASDGSLAQGEAKLATALEEAGFRSVSEARESARRRRQEEEAGRNAQSELNGIAPKESMSYESRSLPYHKPWKNRMTFRPWKKRRKSKPRQEQNRQRQMNGWRPVA